MNKSINLKLTVLFAVIVIAFGAAFTAFASSNDESDLDVLQGCFGEEVEVGDDCKTSDFNDDGIVNSLDIGSFKEVLDTHDLNDDGEITFEDNEDSDLDFLQSCFGLDGTGDCEASDFNDDGIVNSLDIGSFKEVLDTHDLNDDGEITFEDNNEEEESDEEEAAEAIADAQEAISEAETYVEGLEEEEAENCDDTGTLSTVGSVSMCAMSKEISDLQDKLADAKILLEEAETAYENEDWEEAEDKAEAAEDLAEEILDEEEEEEGDEDDSSDYCDRTSKAAGWGVAKKCVDDEDFVINDKMAVKVERSMDRFQGYGESTDKAVLQNQLRELLQVLIKLLQAQIELQEGA